MMEKRAHELIGIFDDCRDSWQRLLRIQGTFPMRLEPMNDLIRPSISLSRQLGPGGALGCIAIEEQLNSASYQQRSERFEL